MPLLRYLSYNDIELFQREINSQIENLLILIPRWIINFSRLYEESQLINKKGAEVIFIVNIKKKIKRFIRNGLNFGLARKSIVYFWEADSKAIYYKYCDIGYDKPNIYRNRFLIYIIYGRDYNINNYKYNIIIYKV